MAYKSRLRSQAPAPPITGQKTGRTPGKEGTAAAAADERDSAAAERMAARGERDGGGPSDLAAIVRQAVASGLGVVTARLHHHCKSPTLFPPQRIWPMQLRASPGLCALRIGGSLPLTIPYSIPVAVHRADATAGVPG